MKSRDCVGAVWMRGVRRVRVRGRRENRMMELVNVWERRLE